MRVMGMNVCEGSEIERGVHGGAWTDSRTKLLIDNECKIGRL